MKYQAEYRNPVAIQTVAARIRALDPAPCTLMEICGGQTHTIAKDGIESLLPDAVDLIHGPGCPVCVTPLAMIENARLLAARPEVILCTFGDMMRVPGKHGDLFAARSVGGDVRIVTTPLEALRLAQINPSRQVVLFAVGFETTAPLTALTVRQAHSLGLKNFSVLAAHVRVPPAMQLLLENNASNIDAFLAAGHVCTVAGTEEYHDIARRFHVPIIVTGFEPLDILLGIEAALRQLQTGVSQVENQYTRCVKDNGNEHARSVVEEIFEVSDQRWRGLGNISAGGLQLRARYATFDAQVRFHCSNVELPEPHQCQAASVLQGRIKPHQCPEFGKGCHPESPMGAPMVSTEGACAAYYRYQPHANCGHA